MCFANTEEDAREEPEARATFQVLAADQDYGTEDLYDEIHDAIREDQFYKKEI